MVIWLISITVLSQVPLFLMSLFPQVRNINMVVQKMKDDIRSCARFIQEPMKLKQNFIELHTRHIHTQDVRIIHTHTHIYAHREYTASYAYTKLNVMTVLGDNRSEC